MTKNDVKTWLELADFARHRARKSAMRNDPWAWAYWRETSKWAHEIWENDHHANVKNYVEGTLRWMEGLMTSCELAIEQGANYACAARYYSQAKWLAIMLRNNGIKVPKQRGPSLRWLRKFEPIC